MSDGEKATLKSENTSKRKLLVALLVAVAVAVLIYRKPQAQNAADNTEAFGMSPSGEVVDSGPMPIEPTGTLVTDDTKLSIGDVVQVNWGGNVILPDGTLANESWWNGEVLDVQEDGKIRTRYSGWRSEWDEVVPREDLRIESLAAEVDDVSSWAELAF